MSKSIKVSERTYQQLELLRERRDTFDGVIHRLLAIMESVKLLRQIAGDGDKAKEERKT